MQQNLDRFKFRAWDGKQMSYNWDWLTSEEGMGICLIDWLASGDTIMQSTGLKDKNGKLIFEGDIIALYHDIHGGTYEVSWLNGQYVLNNDKSFPFNPLHTHHIEVIGNIYETPQFLKIL